jgi:glycine/D-amino acid oxidase-like deaminating enzyme
VTKRFGHGSNVIGILGGGVTGITTGVALAVSGLDVTLYTRQVPMDHMNRPSADPAFATLHAAASVLPHSVRSEHADAWLQTSQACFGALAFCADAGVRVQRHYEMFEDRTVTPPLYADSVRAFELLSDTHDAAVDVPKRRGASALAGWAFDAFFCETPRYLRYLYGLFQALGGRVVEVGQPGNRPGSELVSILGLDHSAVVLCAGLESIELLRRARADGVDDVAMEPGIEPLVDEWDARIVRGHYLRVPVVSVPLDAKGRFFSYNYTPSESIYASAAGPADVYCYPRSDAWFLGGSRQERVVRDGRLCWSGEDRVECSTFSAIDGTTVDIPQPIYQLNGHLIESLTKGGVSLRRIREHDPGSVVGGIGYRFERAHPEESVRVKRSRVTYQGRMLDVVHNYGHGGAGYTFSWGCAQSATQLLAEALGDEVTAARMQRSPDVRFADAASLLKASLEREAGGNDGS